MKVGLVVLLVVLGLVIFYALRSSGFLSKARGLHEVADQFPSKYSHGADGQPAVYVAFGDSTAYGVGATQRSATIPAGVADALSEQGRSVQVVNLSRSGARLHEVVTSQLPKALALEPEVISVSIGGNDATHLTSLANFRADARQLVAELQGAGVRQVIIASSPDMAPVPAIPPGLNWLAGFWSGKLTEIMEQEVAAAGFAYVDLYNDGKLIGRELYAADAFHPNDQGYSRWIQLYAAALE